MAKKQLRGVVEQGRGVKKTTAAFISLSCDNGCFFAALELGKKLFDLFDYLNVKEFRLIEENSSIHPQPDQVFDLVVVEGSVITKADQEKLRDYRKRAKLLVALGACAASGGVPALKNYGDRKAAAKKVYGVHADRVENPVIKPLRDYVKVDYEIYGCPIDGNDFWQAIKSLKAGIIPEVSEQTVCEECQLKENGCLLQEGRVCLGPLIRAGCGATCPSHNYPCDGCHGPLRDPQVAQFEKKVKDIISPDELSKIYERFGIKAKLIHEDQN